MTDNAPYLKDETFEPILEELNTALAPIEQRLVAAFDAPRRPILFVAGLPRSATTMLMQMLVGMFELGYPSNLLARFWQAPYVGARLVQELRRGRRPSASSLHSELGATYGYDEPHEFTYFWRYWFPFNETHQPLDEDLRQRDYRLLQQELGAMESAFGAPLAFKNPVVFSLNMERLGDLFPTSVFLVCRRHPWYVAQSLFQARLKLHGSEERWFSIKPAEYRFLKDLPFAQQIAGQVYYTCLRIDRSLAKLEGDRFLIIDYEELCRLPDRTLRSVAELISARGHELRVTGAPPAIDGRDRQTVDDGVFASLKSACNEFFGSSLEHWGRSRDRLLS